MYETSKSKAIWGDLEFNILKGKGIDIGCGPDPVFPDASRFDQKQGDANHITRYVSDTYDYVYSSHCLEHMNDAASALKEWWKLVKPGGHLFFTVPDEDLYEQGIFPSLGNPDHKATFTIYKEKSWSPASCNIQNLIADLPNAKVVSLVLQDHNYDRKLLSSNGKRPNSLIHSIYFIYLVLNYYLGPKWTFMDPWIKNIHPIDQTMRPHTLAQIQCILKKMI